MIIQEEKLINREGSPLRGRVGVQEQRRINDHSEEKLINREGIPLKRGRLGLQEQRRINNHSEEKLIKIGRLAH